MNYQVLHGEDIRESYLEFLPWVMELDARNYEDDYVGRLECMVARYEKNPRSFVFPPYSERFDYY